MTQYIIEVANCHGGDIAYLNSLIDEFERFEGHGIKFQPLHPDHIATPDFEWYPVYQKLLFNEEQWSEIIAKSKRTKLIWLDLFDVYGVTVLEKNIEDIYGIKLQASILYNQNVIDGLKEVDCSNLKLIINISAIEIEDIKERIQYFNDVVGPSEILLEVGFQSYPTLLADSGLNKVTTLKAKFGHRIVFADHIEGGLDDAITLPLIASQKGADVIEKHVMHSTLETEYDYFSAVSHARYADLFEKIESYNDLIDMPFINERELDYLNKSIQIPIANTMILRGKGVSFKEDISYKRSGLNGLNVIELKKIINSGHILNTSIDKNEAFKKENFKKATIATVIAGRLKSSRLKKKGILKIGALSSVECCVKSCMRFEDTTYTILATSTTPEDRELERHTYSESVLFHTGDPDDVIQRYLDATDKYNIDVVIRVTADMPYVSSEITKILLKSHFETGADYTAAKDAAVGTSPEIINVQALKEVKKHFPNADYSEYMTWYFQNNKEHFRVNIVDLPSELVRNYRLTIDYQEDLEMLNMIQDHLDANKNESTLKNLFEYLDANKEVVKINDHIGLKYKTDQKLIQKLNEVTKIKIT